jgi:maltooligosyltrehalose synthase
LIGAFNGQWADTIVQLPTGRWRNVLTDWPVASMRMAALVARFPVALLLKEEET